MNYRYIEQLIERYFAAETSLGEERILRDFFAQDDVPAHLKVYQPLFQEEAQLSEAHLDKQFDKRLLSMTDEGHVRAHRISLYERLRPMMKAAVFVGLAAMMGVALERSSLGQTSDIGTTQQTADVIPDELDASETTVLDIRSAEVIEHSDSMLLPN